MNTLWYEQEARQWEEALPLGNGRIGAMVYSGVKTEKLCLNDDTLWSGYPKDHNIPDGAKHYKIAQNLALQGKYDEAQKHIESYMLSKNSERYLPMGDLILEMENFDTEVTAYRRELDLETATHTLTYVQNGIEFIRESFISTPDQVLVMRLTTNTPGSLNLIAKMECQLHHQVITTRSSRNFYQNPSEVSATAQPPVGAKNEFLFAPLHNESSLMLNGIAEGHNEPDPAKQGIKFAVIANFTITDGTIGQENSTLCIKNATEIVIHLCCRTNFVNPFIPPSLANLPYLEDVKKDIQNASAIDFITLKSRHIVDYQTLYNRVNIDFGKSNSHIPTPKRLDGWDKPDEDPGLFALLFQYGRYLMISGSRPGTQPLNLQGIWNPHFYAPWSSNYTTNINAEMNYWPAEITNLPECHEPLIDFIQNLRTTGAKTAKVHYNASGFTIHHNSDIWAMATPVEPVEGGARWAFWPLGAGWLSAHVFGHYQYNMDKRYLETIAYPIIKDAARFFLDVLVEDEDGTLIFAPSTSPENDFEYAGGAYSVSKTTTMTAAIIRETLQNAVNCCTILNTDMEFLAEAKTALDRLPAYKIGSRGELFEWNEELPEHEPSHRHTSHLYPLYPGYEITPNTPLAAACARTLELRGEESTGWALAWRICLYARLLDKERAFSFLQKQVRPCEGWRGGCYPNMLGSHPPFQIDSNFGATAGIAELLLQSPRPGVVHLLPALPKELSTGYVKGLRAKGGVTVNIIFEQGKIKKAELVLDNHLPANDFIVMYNETEQTAHLEPGITYEINLLKQ